MLSTKSAVFLNLQEQEATRTIQGRHQHPASRGIPKTHHHDGAQTSVLMPGRRAVVCTLQTGQRECARQQRDAYLGDKVYLASCTNVTPRESWVSTRMRSSPQWTQPRGAWHDSLQLWTAQKLQLSKDHCLTQHTASLLASVDGWGGKWTVCEHHLYTHSNAPAFLRRMPTLPTSCATTSPVNVTLASSLISISDPDGKSSRGFYATTTKQRRFSRRSIESKNTLLW